MIKEKLEDYIDERFSSIKGLEAMLSNILKNSSDVTQLKDLLRKTFTEKTKENVRIIKEDCFIESFFLLNTITQENIKFVLIFFEY